MPGLSVLSACPARVDELAKKPNCRKNAAMNRKKPP
jgi:hypothetical protein